MIAVASSEATNYVLIITDENKKFPLSTPGQWSSREGAEIISKLRKILGMRHNNDKELHVEEVEKRRNQIKKVRMIIYCLALILVKMR